MAQPSVAREPSMEEILASIRRIIESNEPPVSGNVPPGPVIVPVTEIEAESDEIHLSVDEDMLVADFTKALQVSEAGDGFHVPEAPTEAPDEPEAAKTLSLADVAARVRAASERTSQQLRQGEPLSVPATKAESPLVTTRMAELRATSMPSPTAAAAMRVANDPGVAGIDAPRFAEGDDLAEALAAIDMRDAAAETPSIAVPVAPIVERVADPIAERMATALLSPEAGEHVARSFGALAAAVDVSLSRPVDEIAEEMLRPMLQEWLDDNLPTLVERLVREEIERVARGPRR